MGLIGELDLGCHPRRKIVIHRFHVKRSGEISIKARWVEKPGPEQENDPTSSSEEQLQVDKEVEVVNPILKPARLQIKKKPKVEAKTPEAKAKGNDPIPGILNQLDAQPIVRLERLEGSVGNLQGYKRLNDLNTLVNQNSKKGSKMIVNHFGRKKSKRVKVKINNRPIRH